MKRVKRPLAYSYVSITGQTSDEIEMDGDSPMEIFFNGDVFQWKCSPIEMFSEVKGKSYTKSLSN